MPSLKVSEKELGKAFRRNLEASAVAEGAGKPVAALLLLFYAVECGLKHILCVHRRGSYLEQADRLFMTHDLNALVKELRFPCDPMPQTFRLARDQTMRGAVRDCHLAWRYGVLVNSDDEVMLKHGLTTLAARIKEDIY